MQYQLNSAAPDESVSQLRMHYPHLPKDYLDFLVRSNGGEGFVGLSPGYFQLYRAEEIAQLTSEHELSTYCPGYVAVGSSGGGEVYVLSESGNPSGLFMVPAIGMEPAMLRLVAPSFTEFESAFGGAWPA